MKTRQFQQLANLPRPTRDALVVEGLLAIEANVAVIADGMEACIKVDAFRADRMLHNLAREEAGKFLVLIDAYRSPGVDQAVLFRQFKRAGNHLSKLVYAQMADYSIASQAELLSAVSNHRQPLYLDGPNDYDFVFRNQLLMERENALYVDLVESEGTLKWWEPYDLKLSYSAPTCARLVQAIVEAGFASVNGLQVLSTAWSGFDPKENSHFSSWRARTVEALSLLQAPDVKEEDWLRITRFVADRWPMPMVELEVEQEPVESETLLAEREAQWEAKMRREFG